MMKKITTLLCFVVTMHTVFGQTKDSLQTVLSNISKPMERFSATINYLETIDSRAGNNIDSAMCIDLLQVAQQLKNDSPLAISYS